MALLGKRAKARSYLYFLKPNFLISNKLKKMQQIKLLPAKKNTLNLTQ